MADENDKSNFSRVWAMIALSVVALPLLYVLSVGPAGIVTHKFPQLGPPATVFYQPLIWLHDHTFLKGPLEAYVNFWVTFRSF
jgi:hypothetical protein